MDIRISASVVLNDTRADETSVEYAAARPLGSTPENAYQCVLLIKDFWK